MEIMNDEKPKTTAVANWYGSNRMLAAHVGRELLGCSWVGIPFAGGMSELLHIQARTLGVNDLHRAVINLARVMAHPNLGPRLYREMRRRVFHPNELISAQDRCRARLNLEEYTGGGSLYAGPNGVTADAPDPNWAADYFVCSWMGRGGNAGTDAEYKGGLPLRWDAEGGGSATRFFSAASGIVAWRKFLRRCEFSVLDAFVFLERCKDEPGIGVYCDPPFPGPGDKYTVKFTETQHNRLSAITGRYQHARVVMRFYDHPLVRRLYPTAAGWRWIELDGRTQANNAAPEVLLVRN
jgi:DNA adenine methylase